MRTWTTRANGAFADGDAAIRLVEAIGTPVFGTAAVRELARVAPVAYLTAYRKRGDAPPSMLFSGTLGAPDVTARCWRIYRDGPIARDRALEEAVTAADPERTAWAHLTADQIDDPCHRVEVYQRHDLLDRLSIVDALDDGWLAINVFRVGSQGHFRDTELAALEGAAPLAMAFARRHAMLVDASSGPDRLGRARVALARRVPDLTDRELDVCTRLAVGMTFDGIACDLGIAVTSAKTYRNRAFARMGIHHRGQLAPLAWT